MFVTRARGMHLTWKITRARHERRERATIYVDKAALKFSAGRKGLFNLLRNFVFTVTGIRDNVIPLNQAISFSKLCFYSQSVQKAKNPCARSSERISFNVGGNHPINISERKSMERACLSYLADVSRRTRITTRVSRSLRVNIL